MATIKEIARMTNVSPTTVANVIHGRTSKVSKENVERIQKVLNEYNYVPKMGLESLTKGKTRLILVAIHTEMRYQQTPIEDPFYGKITGILEQAIRNAGYYMLLFVDNNIDNIFKTALSWNVTGIITITFSYSNYLKLRSLTNCPVVGIDTYLNEPPFHPEEGYHIYLNDYRAGQMVADRLIQYGFRNITLITDAKIGSSYDRMEGAKKIITSHGLSFHNLFLDRKKQHRISQLTSVFPLAGKEYALFCTCDQIAFEVIGFLEEHGYHVPDDFSVCGFDNNPFAKFSVPKLTTVHQDIAEKAFLAAKMLFSLIRKEPIEETLIELPVELVIRKSLLPLHTSDSE